MLFSRRQNALYSFLSPSKNRCEVNFLTKVSKCLEYKDDDFVRFQTAAGILMIVGNFYIAVCIIKITLSLVTFYDL